MNAGSDVFSVAVSRDGKWVVSGASRGRMTVWNAESRVTGRPQSADRVQRAHRMQRELRHGLRLVSSHCSGKRLVAPLEHDGGQVFTERRLIAMYKWPHSNRTSHTDAILAHRTDAGPAGSSIHPAIHFNHARLTGRSHPRPLHPRHCLEGRGTRPRLARLSRPPLR
jgi:hypothetical protein